MYLFLAVTVAIMIETFTIEARMIQHLLSGSPILALFLVGYLLRRARFFKDGTIDDIKKFVTHISLPALLFNSFLNLDIEGRFLIALIAVYLMCTIMIFIGKGVAKVGHIETPYFPLLMGGFEMGMFGYAMFISLYGVEQLGKIAFLTIGQTIFVFTILMTQLMHLRDGKQSFSDALKRFFTSPIILSIAAGIVAEQLRDLVPTNDALAAAGSFIRLLGSVTVPLITMTIGYGLDIGKEGIGLSLTTIAIRKLFLVAFALLINRYVIGGWLRMESMYRYAMLILALSPPAFVVSIFARTDNERDTRYINRTISLDSVLSIFLTMIAATLYH